MPKYKHGSGSVYRRGKTWWLTYYVNGHQVWESAKTKDKATARQKLQEKIGQRAEGRLVVGADRVTFEGLVEGLLTDYRVNGKKSLDCAERRVRLHLAPFFGGRKAQEITTTDIVAYTARRQEQGASNGEINRELSLLKRAFNLAAETITKKPRITMLKENNARQGFFERAEFEAVLGRLPSYLRSPITFAYLVGWRIRSEILPLTWKQIDLEEQTVQLETGTTKNEEGRLIYLPRVLQEPLEAQWQDHLAHYPECPWVFHNHGERILTFYKAWHRACQDAGVPGKIPHDFRRTAVRNMVRAGIPERVAMQIAGHKTREIFDRYHIVSKIDLQEAACKLSEQFSAQTMTKTMTVGMSEQEPLTLTH
jgi:integrase